MSNESTMKYLLPIVGLMLMSLGANAQRGQVENALQKKYTEQYANPGVNKFNDYMNNTFGGKTEDSYKFPLYLKMHLVEYKNGKKKDETYIQYYIDGSSMNFALSGLGDNKGRNSNEDMTIVYDSKNTTMIMLNEGQKTAMAINYGAFMNMGMQSKTAKKYQDDMKDISCKKTGKSKTIQGYNCVQYQCVDNDEDGKYADVWITDGIVIDLDKASGFGLWNMALMNNAKIGGMMLEGQFYENNQITSSIEITELDKNANYNILMSNYQMTSLGGGR